MKDLIVHVDNTPQCARRLRLAVQLAAAFDARLFGVFAQHAPILPSDEGSLHGIEAAAVTAPERLEYGAQITQAEAAAAEKLFNKGVAQRGVSAAWRTMAGSSADVIVAYARYADLAIVGQTLPGGEDVAADVVSRAGRPVLVAPHAEGFPLKGERALVAWDASREATRALHDALPLLGRAREVSLFSIGPPEKTPPGMDVTALLKRHGVEATLTQGDEESADVGAALLAQAARLGSDVIVMGAYGHSRLRELVLGGTKRHVLRHATVPVLVAH
jgi:nucleotide-binding universal stress UspA family protein